MVLLSLCSCTTLGVLGGALGEVTSARSIRNLFKAPPTFTEKVTIISPRPPYIVKYNVFIRGPKPNQPVRLETMASGKYRNWSWKIDADPKIAVEVARWFHALHAAWIGERSSRSALLPDFTWGMMIRRIYDLDVYLSGIPPPPAKIRLLLLPQLEYRFRNVLRSDRSLPVRAVFYSKKSERNQTLNVFTLLSELNAFIADTEWKAGHIPKPRAGALRFEKFTATKICWGLMAGMASIAGSPERLGRPLKGHWLPQLSTWYVDLVDATTSLSSISGLSRRTKERLALIWLGAGMHGYLKKRGLKGVYPDRSTDLRWVNSAINFCRAYTHYTGNIESHPVPLLFGTHDQFFRPHRVSQIDHPGLKP